MEESSGKSLSYIVGGSSGMGLATARLLVADGGTVVLVAREQDKLAARKSELEAGDKGKVETIAADFYDELPTAPHRGRGRRGRPRAAAA